MNSEAYRAAVGIVEQYAGSNFPHAQFDRLCRQIGKTPETLSYADYANLLLQMTMDRHFNETITKPALTALYNDLMREYRDKFTDKCELQELFLVSKNSGYLLGHCEHTGRDKELDGDIMAGMLTAIQTFVRQAFDLKEWENISIIHMGKIKMMIEHSKYLYGAIIFSGPDSENLRASVRDFLGSIETTHEDALLNWKGSVEFLADIQTRLDTFFELVNTNYDLDPTPPEFMAGTTNG